jgi:GTPase SAR1 family protein
VILFGLSGVGKSTLINSLLRKPLAPTGVGDLVTMTVERYEEPGIPITLFTYETVTHYLNQSTFTSLYCVREGDRRFPLRGASGL